MFKHFIASWTFVLLATVCFAQQNITVKVVDEKSSPLANATVTVGNTVNQTDKSGTASFSLGNSKSVSLRVKHLGYKEYSGSTDRKSTRLNSSHVKSSYAV